MIKQRKKFSPHLLQLEERITLTASLGANIVGLNVGNAGWVPPDTNLAVGPAHVVETVNEMMAIYNKSDGSLISTQSLPSLFGGITGDLGTFDPSIMYDDNAGRFVVEAAVKDTLNHKAYVDIAVSNSADPTQGFSETHQIEVDEGGNNWVDNGKLGGNADVYVYTGNSYSFTGSYVHEMVVTIDKGSVLDQNSSTITDYLVTRRNNFSMIPARIHGSVAGDPMWFVETDFGGGSSIDVVKMTNVDTASPSFNDSNLQVNSYSYSMSAVQPGGSVDIIDCRTLNVEWNNNNLVAAFDSFIGTDNAAAWVQFNTTSNPVVIQQGIIHPADGVQTYFPAVSVDSAGNVGMTYMQSSLTEYPSMYVTGRTASDPSNIMEAPILVEAGTATLSPSRAGDYAGLVPDPSTPQTFWAANEYSTGGWSTGLVQFTITGGVNVQPPLPPSNLVAAVVSTTRINLTWTDNSDNESGFIIQRSNNGGKSWTNIATVGANVINYSDTTVSKRKTYQYRVASYNIAGTSTWSNVATATTPVRTHLYPKSKNLFQWRTKNDSRRFGQSNHGPGKRGSWITGWYDRQSTYGSSSKYVECAG